MPLLLARYGFRLTSIIDHCALGTGANMKAFLASKLFVKCHTMTDTTKGHE
jgi:hypothetical protein